MNAVELLAGAHRRVPWGVALTFDLLPSPSVLDALRDLDVRATFFLLGREAQAQPDVVLRMRAEGHGVGSRSRSSTDLTVLGREEIDAEIEGGLVDLQLVLGRRTTLFRPPQGRLSWRVAFAMRRARLDSWLCTVDGEWHGLRERDVVCLDVDVLDALPETVRLARSRALDFVAL